MTRWRDGVMVWFAENPGGGYGQGRKADPHACQEVRKRAPLFPLLLLIVHPFGHVAVAML